MLDYLAVRVEAEDVDTRSFLTSPVQVTYVYKGQISIDGDAFDLAGYAPGLLGIQEPYVLAFWGCGTLTRRKI
jgi:hypothetical protein